MSRTFFRLRVRRIGRECVELQTRIMRDGGQRMLRIAVMGLGLLAFTPAAFAQDAAAGEKVFLQCRSCHQVGPTAKNQIGPVLNGLFGRTAGHVEGYAYSDANKKSGLTWDEATFRDYIKDPKAKVPGTKMIYAGLKDEKRVSDLIAYLHTFDTAPVTLIK
jgi:cytochrome c